MNSDRDAARAVFFTAWKKYNEKAVLEPLESQLVELILLHPEYHEVLTSPEKFQAADFSESNPFLHLSLHLALREQISTNRPEGIANVYQTLCASLQDPHLVEHRMLECLGRILWDAQISKKAPDEQIYLEMLRKLL